MAHIRLICGTARSSRAERLDEILRQRWGRTRLIVPTRRYARQRTLDLIHRYGLPGVWGRPISSFQDFVAELLAPTSHAAANIGPLEQRLLLEQALDAVRRGGLVDGLTESAATGGFLNHLHHVIAQLKQAAITPEDFRDRSANLDDPESMDGLVAAVYSAYQEALHRAEVYDLQGMYWIAAIACDGERLPLFESVDTVLLDGFDDFTPSEFRLIERMAPYLTEMVFGIHFDAAPGRGDVFATQQRTVQRIREAFDVFPEFAESPPPVTRCEWIADGFLSRDPVPEGQSLSEDVWFVECHNLAHEVETAAREIKSLLIGEGAAPDTIALVSRNIARVLTTARDVFREFGIPLTSPSQPALTDSGFASFLLQLYSAIDGWGREAVLDVLVSPYFSARGEYSRMFPLLARQAQIIAGHDQWTARIKRLGARVNAGTGADIEQLLHKAPNVEAGCAALLDAVEKLKRFEADLPATGTAKVHAEALGRVLGQLPVADALNVFLPATRPFEVQAAETVNDLLGRLWHWSGDTVLSRREFTSHFRRALDTATVNVPEPARGVQCLDLESIRHLRMEYVFLVDATENSLPRAPEHSAIYGDGDRARLRRCGIMLDDVESHAHRELTLFHHLLDTPRRMLTISWHTSEANEQASGPSPYVQDLLALMPRAEVAKPASNLDTIVPPPERAACLRDARNLAVTSAPPLLKAFPSEMSAVQAGAEIESRRQRAAPLDQYDGILRAPGLIAHLEKRFGPAHTFSVSQLETYAACPFRYFMERVLGIREEQALDEAFDPLVRGTILHAILERFHRRYQGMTAAEIPQDEARQVMEEIVRGAFEDLAWRSSNAPDAVIAAERERMLRGLHRYLVMERERNEAWRPSHFEVAFGRRTGESMDPPGRVEPLALDTSAGEVRFAGQIDRVDRLDGMARIIDYKSTVYTKQKDIDEGRSLQLSIYALALAELLPDAECTEAYFLRPDKKKDRVEGLGKAKGNWGTRAALALKVAGACVNGIRAGQFHLATEDESCFGCPKAAVCRYERARMERKSAARTEAS